MNHIDPQIEKHKFVFSAFREAHFSLSLQMKHEEYPKDDFADVKTIMRDDSIVEWQLGGWLDEDQMRMARKKERLEAELRTVFSRIPNTTANFRLCLILPRDDAERFQKSEADALKSELQHLIQKTDSDWTAQPHLQSRQGRLCREFTKYPRLERYLHSFMLMPREVQDRPHQQWIEMEGWGGAYNPLTAVEALRKIVGKKAGRYGGLQGIDARLLIHYDEAILYNSPYHDTDTTLEDMAQLAGHWLSLDFPNQSTTFREVYLLHTPARCAYQVCPAIFKCMGENVSPCS